MANCDLLIVLGTSLSVEPVANLVEEVQDHTPRLLINRELVGPFRVPHSEMLLILASVIME